MRKSGAVEGANKSPWIKKGLLFVVSAPSGAGKTSLCREVVKYAMNLQHSISYTTRSLRPSEKDSTDYHFVSMEKFKKLIDEDAFVEWAVVHGNYYGTPKRELTELLDSGIDVILDIDSQGAAQIKATFKYGVFIYVLPPSFDDLKQRLIVRQGDTPDEINERLSAGSKEIRDYNMYDFLIINDDFDRALKELESIVVSARVKIDRLNPEWAANFFEKEGG